MLSGQLVTAGDELASRLFEGVDVFERADFVVLTRDDLEQWARIGNMLCQKVDQECRRGDERIDARRIVRRVRIVGEVLQGVPHAVVNLLACLADLRFVEQAESQVTRDVADDRVAHLRRNDQALQYLTDRTRRSGWEFGGGEPASEQRGDHGHLVLHALQREE